MHFKDFHYAFLRFIFYPPKMKASQLVLEQVWLMHVKRHILKQTKTIFFDGMLDYVINQMVSIIKWFAFNFLSINQSEFNQ